MLGCRIIWAVGFNWGCHFIWVFGAIRIYLCFCDAVMYVVQFKLSLLYFVSRLSLGNRISELFRNLNWYVFVFCLMFTLIRRLQGTSFLLIPIPWSDLGKRRKASSDACLGWVSRLLDSFFWTLNCQDLLLEWMRSKIRGNYDSIW